MRPSDMNAGQDASDSSWPLPYPRSDIAEPPITESEARAADTSICRNHKGLVSQTGEREGIVLFCPVGREYWRYTKRQSGMYAPLRYGPSGIV